MFRYVPFVSVIALTALSTPARAYTENGCAYFGTLERTVCQLDEQRADVTQGTLHWMTAGYDAASGYYHQDQWYEWQKGDVMVIEVGSYDFAPRIGLFDGGGRMLTGWGADFTTAYDASGRPVYWAKVEIPVRANGSHFVQVTTSGPNQMGAFTKVVTRYRNTEVRPWNHVDPGPGPQPSDCVSVCPSGTTPQVGLNGGWVCEDPSNPFAPTVDYCP